MTKAATPIGVAASRGTGFGLFLRSLIACILSHGVFNALSAFANEAVASMEMKILTAALLTVITASYGAYIAWSMQREKVKNDEQR